MASIIFDKKTERFAVQFKAVDKRRRTIRLGKVTRKSAEIWRNHVENILAAQTPGRPLDVTTAAWLAALPDDDHEKLVRVGLVDPREKPEPQTLKRLFDAYFDTVNVQASTKRTYEQSRSNLEAFLGCDKLLAEIGPLDADRWRRSMEEKFAKATIAKRVKVARQAFAKAVQWGWIDRNPMEGLKAGSMTNPERLVYVPVESVERILAATTDPEWRVLIALSRFGALRVPSEAVRLRWEHVDWQGGRLTIPSPKTANSGRDRRVIPLFPELREHLLAAFEAAPDGSEFVLRRRDPTVNLRTGLLRLLAQAGVESWPRVWHNMRASRATELAAEFPGHVAAAWCGHTEAIAEGHYWQVRDEDFDRAVKGACSALQNPVQPGATLNHTDTQHRRPKPRSRRSMRGSVVGCGSGKGGKVTPGGFEPPFPG